MQGSVVQGSEAESLAVWPRNHGQAETTSQVMDLTELT